MRVISEVNFNRVSKSCKSRSIWDIPQCQEFQESQFLLSLQRGPEIHRNKGRNFPHLNINDPINYFRFMYLLLNKIRMQYNHNEKMFKCFDNFGIIPETIRDLAQKIFL